jgi:hypothetical protein
VPPLRRRDALLTLAAGAAGLACGRHARAAAAADDGIPELASRLRAAAPAAAFDAAVEAIRRGATPGTMLGAIFLAGVQDVRPRPHGILHTVMMVESSFQLADVSAPAEAWLPVLWNLDDLKRAQESDRVDDGDWVLSPTPAVRTASPEAARREFAAAMEAWDAPRAERAVIGLCAHLGHEQAFETIWPRAARCYAFIGHKMIYAVQVERVLRRIGWRHAEPALRSLVLSALVGRDTASFERSRALASTLPAGWAKGAEDPAHSGALHRELRGRTPAAAQQVVADAFREGRGPQTAWDALRLWGAEVFARRVGRSAGSGRAALLPVHAVTVTHAFGHAFRSTRSDATRRLLVLQAAGWLAALRDDLARIVGLAAEIPGADAPVPAEPDFARLRRSLFRTAQEHHQHKYLAALAEETRLVHPRWAEHLAASAGEYLAHPADPETEVYRRSMAALRAAGATS